MFTIECQNCDNHVKLNEDDYLVEYGSWFRCPRCGWRYILDTSSVHPDDELPVELELKPVLPPESSEA